MKRIVAAVVLMLAAANATAGDPRVENVRARQIPDTKDVEVVYDLVAPDGGLFKVSAIFQAPGVAPEVKTVTGDFGSNVAPGRNRRFVWDAGADWPNSVNRNFTCTVGAEEQDPKEPLPVGAGVQLWSGGPYWAECNVGASKPEGYGLYFYWGDEVGHAGDWDFNVYWEEVIVDSAGNLAPGHDAARAHLGAPWRMPTAAEIDALVSNCTMALMTRNGVIGCLVTGKGAYASKSIFLPAAGYGVDSCLWGLGVFGDYWSSTLDSVNPYKARVWGFSNFSDFFFFNYSTSELYYGHPVRPVR